MPFVLVPEVILEIHKLSVDVENVLQIVNVHLSKYAKIIIVLIPVTKLVERMLNVMFEIILQLVRVLLDGPESQQPTVEDTIQMNSVSQARAEEILIVGLRTTGQFAVVRLPSSEIQFLDADTSVKVITSAPVVKHARTSSAKIHAPTLVEHMPLVKLSTTELSALVQKTILEILTLDASQNVRLMLIVLQTELVLD